MRVKSELIFLECKEKQKIDGTGKYNVIVLYDEKSEELIKPFCDNEGLVKQLAMLQNYTSVICDLDVYNGKRGMSFRLNSVATKKGDK